MICFNIRFLKYTSNNIFWKHRQHRPLITILSTYSHIIYRHKTANTSDQLFSLRSRTAFPSLLSPQEKTSYIVGGRPWSLFWRSIGVMSLSFFPSLSLPLSLFYTLTHTLFIFDSSSLGGFLEVQCEQ